MQEKSYFTGRVKLARSRRHLRLSLRQRMIVRWKMSHIRPLIVLPLFVFLVMRTSELVHAQEVYAPTDNKEFVVRYVDVNTMQPASKWEEFVAASYKVSKIYNYPVNVVLAQGALESGRGTSRYAIERNNFLGIGAYDSHPDLALAFENPEQCVIEYMRIIRTNFPEAWEKRENPDELLSLLKKNSNGRVYATDPDYISKVKSMDEWR